MEGSKTEDLSFVKEGGQGLGGASALLPCDESVSSGKHRHSGTDSRTSWCWHLWGLGTWGREFESLEMMVSFPAAGTWCVEEEELLFQGQM